MVGHRSQRPRYLSVSFLLLLLLPLTSYALPHDATVVTDLRVVHGASDAAAREACAALCPCRDALTAHVTTNWFVVGANLYTKGDDAFTYLCMRQDRRAAVERDSALRFALQSVAVVESARACPSSMVTLFTPRDGVVVCLQRVPLTDALATGAYISNMDAVLASTMATSNRNASQNTDGWISEPTSVHGPDPQSPDVYLRYKRPVRPIISTKFLSNVDATTNGAMACRRQLGESWEPAGAGYLVDERDASKRTLLCVQRAYIPPRDGVTTDAATSVSLRVLTQIRVIPPTSVCASDFQDQSAVSSVWKACFKYEDIEIDRTTATATPTLTHRFLSHVGLTTRSVIQGIPVPPDLSLASTVDLNNERNGVATYMLIQDTNYTTRAMKRRLTPVAIANTTAIAKPLSAKPPLRARVIDAETANPKLAFKVLQIADLHLTGDPDRYCLGPPIDHAACGMTCTENLTIAFLNDLLDEEKPDLVMFSGDTITVREWGLKAAALHAALQPVEARGIPYAWIMGNHDDDYVYDRHEIMDKLVTRELAYVESGPSTIQGVGNYVLDIKPPATASDAWGDTNRSVFRVYCLDSNKNRNATLFPKINSRYDWIRPDQIDFYQNRSLQNQQLDSASTPTPAIMFFHIPIPEYASFWSFFFRKGEKHEKTEGTDHNSGLLATLRQRQEVKATFAGHDHTNEFCYKTHGVQLCYGGGTGFGAAIYDGNVARRARVIEWTMDSTKKRRITSWKRHFGKRFRARQRQEVLYSEG